MMLKRSTWIWFAIAVGTASPAAAQLSYSVTVGGPRYYVVEPAPAVVRPMWGRPVYVGRRGYYYARPMPVYVERPVVVAPQVVQPATAPPAAAPQVKPVPQTQRTVPPKPAPLVQASKKTPAATTVSNPKKSVAQPVSQVEMEPLLTPLEEGETVAEKPVTQPPAPGPIVIEQTNPVSAVPIKFKGKLPEGPTAPFTCTHVYTGATFEIQIPAALTIREIDQGKRSIEIEFEEGEVDVRFHRDGSATVDYEF